ncbi:MAG TPA: outer membrane protein assembly factor BamD [Myxococcota bacterium]|nr:outer membrane protein assembly factor BamD [Myxococcota bacterium]HQK50790.1 outer membrane protein assembly factor BamD [Myxococcota bacterium]
MTFRNLLTRAILAGACLVGCGAGQTVRDGSPASQGRRTVLSESRDDYLAGLKALRDGDYATAIETLQRVARGPSYIPYTAMARLRIADALFFQEKYEEAVEGYRTFIDTSAGDPNLHYAYFRLAESRVKAIAGEFFLVPPSDRRDQQRVRGALAACRDFLARFPDSPFVPEALAMMDRMSRTVASFEMEVARFYRSRDKPAGAAGRLRRLMEDLPQTGRLEEVRAAWVEAMVQAREPGWEQECRRYLEDFPGGSSHARIRRLCGRPGSSS